MLLIAALLLLLYNRRESDRAGETAEEAAQLLAEIIWVTPSSEPIGEEAAQTAETPEKSHSTEENIRNIDGYDYIGVLQIPVLELELGVMSRFDYDRLSVAPCRQTGSAVTDDMVIVAHNFDRHFGKLKTLQVGDSIVFTDVDGVENAYSVARMETVEPTDVEHVLQSGYPLVLYTCTYGGKSRVTVFCERIAEAEK